ncbi:MAG: SPFH domain-containing protein [Anaerolineae bacterium]
MHTEENESPNLMLMLTIALITFLAFTVGLFVIFYVVSPPAEHVGRYLVNLFLLSVAFGTYLLIVVLTVLNVLAPQFLEQLYDLSREEARQLSFFLFAGLPIEPPRRPLLRVQEGRTLADGPLVMYMDKVGGPGYLSIAHDSAVVTGKLGKLRRVLGPGFHRAEPFEKVWDVIDLRPQRRTLHVEFMTTDGIPACCDAEIRFQVAGPNSADFTYPHEEGIPPQPFPFDPAVILKLATAKYVKSSAGTGRIQDWRIGLVNGLLDGILRDTLEKYSLDHFFNPRYWALQSEGAVDKASPPPEKPVELLDIQARVEEAVKRAAAERGIFVDTVQLGPVLPEEEAISRQWLEFWQARVQRPVTAYNLSEDARRRQMLEKTSVDAQVELVTSMLSKLQDLDAQKSDVPPQLIVMSFMDVLRTMSDRDPAVQLLMYQQAESLMRIINAIQSDKPPFAITSTSSASSTGSTSTQRQKA